MDRQFVKNKVANLRTKGFALKENISSKTLTK